MTTQRSRILDKRQAADLAILLLLAAISAVYCYDAARASTHIYNLIMVLPLTVAILILCTIRFVAAVRAEPVEVVEVPQTAGPWPVILSFSFYVVSLNWLGFDVGTAVFVAVFLWLHGERRWPWLFGYSIVFAVLLTSFFTQMLPYPMPVLLPELLSAFSF